MIVKLAGKTAVLMGVKLAAQMVEEMAAEMVYSTAGPTAETKEVSLVASLAG